MQTRLSENEYGLPRLTTPDQAEGYVLGIKPGEYASWKEPLIRETRRAAQGHGHPEWESNTPMDYGGTDLQRARSLFHEQVAQAREDGVDMTLLSDSVRAIQRAADYYQENSRPNLDARTVQDPVIGLPQQDFDQIFRQV